MHSKTKERNKQTNKKKKFELSNDIYFRKILFAISLFLTIQSKSNVILIHLFIAKTVKLKILDFEKKKLLFYYFFLFIIFIHLNNYFKIHCLILFLDILCGFFLFAFIFRTIIVLDYCS